MRRQPIEDSRVEAKSEWPEARRAARQIAAHANEARGEPILWLIGLDEKSGSVSGADNKELADWWAKVCSSFDDLYPTLQSINVPAGNNIVVALLMETNRFPYVIKHPDGGQIQYEVPWREARSTRTARRRDLIRLLEPQINVPLAEVLDASARITQDSGGFHWDMRVTLYVSPAAVGQQIVLPFHRARIEFWNDSLEASDWRISMSPLTRFHAEPGNFKTVVDSHTVLGSGSEVIVHGPGVVIVEATRGGATAGLRPNAPAKIRFSFPFVHGVAPLVIEHTIPPAPVEGGAVAMWRYSP